MSASAPAVHTPFRFKHMLHAFSVAVLVGVRLAACVAGFLYATSHLLGLPEILLEAILGLTLLASLALTAVLFVRTMRVEAALERGADAAAIGWNPLKA